MSETSLVSHNDSHEMLQQCEALMREKVSHNAAALFHLTSGGSRTRAKLCIDAGKALRLSPQSFIATAGAIELLHNASLIHDDLQDGDENRRGNHSVWKKFGKGHAICAGDLMISAAYSLLAEVDANGHHVSLFSTMHQAIADTVEGQHLDIGAQNTLSENDYEKIAALKSGPLIQLTLSLPLLLAGYEKYIDSANTALAQFAVAYQILDDLDDWQQDSLRGHLNIVNLVTSKSSHSKAIFAVHSRSQYLLEECHKTLALMPRQCAASMIETAMMMQQKADDMLVNKFKEK